MPETADLYTEEWVAALTLLQPLITKQDLVDLATRVTFDEQEPHESVRVAYFRLHPGSPYLPRRVVIVLNRAVRSFYTVERVEALLWAAAMAHIWLTTNKSFDNTKPLDIHQAYCRQLGVACTSLVSTEVRWRMIEAAGGATEALLNVAEWPFICEVCKRPITSEEGREDVHKNCFVYAQTVILKRVQDSRARLAAIEAERLEQEEIDDAAG